MLKVLIDIPVLGQARDPDCRGFAPPGLYNVTPCDKDTVFLESLDDTFVVKRTVLQEYKQQEKAV
jgi:hypothetical protein